MNNFTLIDQKLAELNKLRPLTQGELQRLQDEFLVEFTYNSNAIEGNTLTLHETAMVLSQGVTIDKKPLKDHLEAVGHKDAFLYVLSLVQDKIQLSEKIIKEIHSLILIDRREDSGVYRRIPVRIMGATHEPPQPYLISKLMETLISEYEEMKNNLHPVHYSALFHLKFEGIHPFIDGNGRTGRLLLNLELMQAGFPPINVKFADRKKYYECFESYTTTGSEDDMINLIGSYVLAELERYIEILK
jgi:Fic family protein